MSIISWIKKQVERKPANCRRADWTDEDEDEDDCCDEEAEQEAHDRGEEDRERLERLYNSGRLYSFRERVPRSGEFIFVLFRNDPRQSRFVGQVRNNGSIKVACSYGIYFFNPLPDDLWKYVEIYRERI